MHQLRQIVLVCAAATALALPALARDEKDDAAKGPTKSPYTSLGQFLDRVTNVKGGPILRADNSAFAQTQVAFDAGGKGVSLDPTEWRLVAATYLGMIGLPLYQVEHPALKYKVWAVPRAHDVRDTEAVSTLQKELLATARVRTVEQGRFRNLTIEKQFTLPSGKSVTLFLSRSQPLSLDELAARPDRCTFVRAQIADEIERALSQPEATSKLLATKDPSAPGLRMQRAPGRSLLAEYGLARGDRISAINGKALGANADRYAVYQALAKEATVDLTVHHKKTVATIRCRVVD